jgi:hypothetical protein
MSCGRDAELLGNLEVAATGAASLVARDANQGLEGVVARLAAKFIERHVWNDSSCPEPRVPALTPMRNG